MQLVWLSGGGHGCSCSSKPYRAWLLLQGLLQYELYIKGGCKIVFSAHLLSAVLRVRSNYITAAADWLI